MHCLSGRKLVVPENDSLRATYNAAINGQNLIHEPQQSVKRGLDGFAAMYCHVAVENLLQHLCVRDQPPTLPDQFLNPSLCVGFMRVCGAYKVHRDVGID